MGKRRGVGEILSSARSSLKLAGQKQTISLSVFSDPENVCINSHSQLEALLYYDSVDQYTLRALDYDRWPDNCVRGLIGLSGNEVAL